MNLWFPMSMDFASTKYPQEKLGHFIATDQKEEMSDSFPKLVEVRTIETINNWQGEHVWWFIPAGYGAHLFLIEAGIKTERPFYIAINGINHNSFTTIINFLEGSDFTICFDARGIPVRPYYQQLAWLKAHFDGACAVVAEEVRQIETAVLINPEALIIPSKIDDNCDFIHRLNLLYNGKGTRPLSPEEVDLIEDHNISLSVNRKILVGEKLREEDLVVIQTDSKGLSPAILKKVVNQTLRYQISQGEPLTFGHFVGLE